MDSRVWVRHSATALRFNNARRGRPRLFRRAITPFSPRRMRHRFHGFVFREWGNTMCADRTSVGCQERSYWRSSSLASSPLVRHCAARLVLERLSGVRSTVEIRRPQSRIISDADAFFRPTPTVECRRTAIMSMELGENRYAALVLLPQIPRVASIYLPEAWSRRCKPDLHGACPTATSALRS